jgi:hypothetical protein
MASGIIRGTLPKIKESGGVCPSHARVALSKIRRITRKRYLLLWFQCLLVFTNKYVNSVFSDTIQFSHLRIPLSFISTTISLAFNCGYVAGQPTYAFRQGHFFC